MKLLETFTFTFVENYSDIYPKLFGGGLMVIR